MFIGSDKETTIKSHLRWMKDLIKEYELIKSKNIWHEINEHGEVFTMEDLAKIELPYPEYDAKNIFHKIASISIFSYFTTKIRLFQYILQNSFTFLHVCYPCLGREADKYAAICCITSYLKRKIYWNNF